MSPLTIALLGVGGALIAQFLILLWRSSQPSSDFPRPPRAAAEFAKLIGNSLFSGAMTAAYFYYVDLPPRSIVLVLNYGFFASLVLLEIEGSISTTMRPTATAAGAIPWTLAAATPAASGMILNGFWPVFGVGVFGAFLAELLTFFKDRRKQITLPKSYWLIAGLVIVSGGGLTVLHGVQQVSALLALQLGASPPLFVKQVTGR